MFKHKISRKYAFSAAHRLEGHPKCGRLHGHNYVVEVWLEGPLKEGMVVDYGLMDHIVKPVIDEFDHRFIVSHENRDSNCVYTLEALRNKDAVDLPAERSTAECLSKYFYELFAVAFSKNPDFVHTVVAVSVMETEKSVAIYTP